MAQDWSVGGGVWAPAMQGRTGGGVPQGAPRGVVSEVREPAPELGDPGGGPATPKPVSEDIASTYIFF